MSITPMEHARPVPVHSLARPPWKGIIWGGLVAGTVDIGSTTLIYHQTPGYVCHSIASGLLGAAAFQSTHPAAVLGLGLQWAMSILIAAIYMGATVPVPILRRRWLAGGTIAGLIIFAVMNYVVIPLSAAQRDPHPSPAKRVENLAAMLLFGWLIAFFCRPKSAGS